MLAVLVIGIGAWMLWRAKQVLREAERKLASAAMMRALALSQYRQANKLVEVARQHEREARKFG